MSKANALKNAATKTASVQDIRKRSPEDRLRLAEEQESLPHPGLGQFLQSDPTPTAEPVVGFVPYTPGMEVKIGMQLSVPLEMLAENENNSRAIYSESDVEDMRRSLELDGQMQPALVYPPSGPDQRFMIKEGQTRFYALQKNKHPTMNVLVVEPLADPLQAFRQSRIVNKKRNSLTVFDDAIRFKAVLAENPHLKIKDLAELLDESDSYIVKTQKIAELPRELLMRMQDSKEKFGVSTSYGVALFHKTATTIDQTVALLDKICAGEISSKRLQEITSDRSATIKTQEGHSRARPLRRSEVRGGGKGELKLFPKGRIELKLILDDRKKEAQLYEKLREVFVEHGLAFADEESAPQA